MIQKQPQLFIYQCQRPLRHQCWQSFVLKPSEGCAILMPLVCYPGTCRDCVVLAGCVACMRSANTFTYWLPIARLGCSTWSPVHGKQFPRYPYFLQHEVLAELVKEHVLRHTTKLVDDASDLNFPMNRQLEHEQEGRKASSTIPCLFASGPLP